MTYYFDTNVLITANRLDFPMATNREFWDWLVELAGNNIVQIPESVHDEIGDGNDGLALWVKENKTSLVCPTQEAISSVPIVLNAYGDHIDERTLERIKADPYVIAHAHNNSASVVTYEIGNNATAPHNKKIPSVCECLNVPCLRFPKFLWVIRQMLPST